MKKAFLFVLLFPLIPTYCFSAETFFHDNRKIKIQYLKRGDFNNHKINIKGTISGGQACSEGTLSVGVRGLGKYTTKNIKITKYNSKQFFRTSVLGPKKQPYGKVKIRSASFFCYR